MKQATILFVGQRVVVACDGNCKKAWGVHSRPHIVLSDDPDDYVSYTDEELGTAPDDPGTYEGGHAKPPNSDYFPNKWCVRECERCAMVKPGEEIVLPDFSNPFYNIPSSAPITPA